MTTTYTPILNIPQVAPNQNNKETTINTGLAIVEAAFNDAIAVDASAGNVTLTTDQYTKYMMMRVQGHSVARNLNTPAASGSFTGKRFFIVSNEGTGTVTVKPGGAGTGTIDVSAGKITLIQSTGTVLRAVSSGVALLTDLSDVDLTTMAPTDGQVLKYNGTTHNWDAGDFSASTFTALSDAPASYTSQANKFVRVNSGESALVFGTMALIDISDFPTFSITNALEILRVKADGTGVEWATPEAISAPALTDLSDVDDTTPPADGQTVVWDQTAGKWKFEDVENGGGPVTISYTFDTTTTNSDPGSGKLRLDSGTQNAALHIRADLLDSNGADWTSVIDSLDDSTSTIKGYIRLTAKKDSTKFILFSVSAVGSESGYRNITVAPIAYSGTTPFANNDHIILSFERTGDKGATGTAGNFTDIADAPSSYSGKALQLVRVKATADGVEFVEAPCDIGFSISGKPDALQQINIPLNRAVKLITSLTGSTFYIGTNPTSTMTFDLNKVHAGTPTSIGSVAFNMSGVPTATFSSDISFADGDLLQIIAPTSQDATGANLAMSFKGVLL